MALMLAPLTPHVAEELWEKLGHASTIAFESFPAPDPALLVDDEVEIPVQVNGKVRGHVRVAPGADDIDARSRSPLPTSASPRCSTVRWSARSSSYPAGS